MLRSLPAPSTGSRWLLCPVAPNPGSTLRTRRAPTFPPGSMLPGNGQEEERPARQEAEKLPSYLLSRCHSSPRGQEEQLQPQNLLPAQSQSLRRISTEKYNLPIIPEGHRA